MSLLLVYYLYVSILNLEYCELKFPTISSEKLKRDLTSKCGEERRKMKKAHAASLINVQTK